MVIIVTIIVFEGSLHHIVPSSSPTPPHRHLETFLSICARQDFAKHFRIEWKVKCHNRTPTWLLITCCENGHSEAHPFKIPVITWCANGVDTRRVANWWSAFALIKRNADFILAASIHPASRKFQRMWLVLLVLLMAMSVVSWRWVFIGLENFKQTIKHDS